MADVTITELEVANELTGQKRSSNMIAFAAHTSYQKRFNKVWSFVQGSRFFIISHIHNHTGYNQ